MLPPEIATDTIERLRPVTATNGYDDSGIPDWNQTPTSLSIADCSLQPEQGPEFLDNRAAVVSRWRLYAPYDADVLSSDRIRFDSVTFQVDGSVQKWRDPTGAGFDHLTCLLRKTSG